MLCNGRTQGRATNTVHVRNIGVRFDTVKGVVTWIGRSGC